MEWVSWAIFRPVDLRQRFPQVAVAFAKEASAVVLSAAKFTLARGWRNEDWEKRIILRGIHP